MKLKQLREDVKTLKEMNCQAIAGRVYRLILAMEGMTNYMDMDASTIRKREAAVLKDAKGD